MASSVDVTVAVHSMIPYTRLDIIDGEIKVSGCIGEVWKVLTNNLSYSVHSMYSLEENELTDIILTNNLGSHHHQLGIHLSFLTSWYEVHVEEKQATLIKLSYTAGSKMFWFLFLGITLIHILMLFVMLKCADKYCPISPVDLPPLPSKGNKKLYGFNKKELHQALTYRRLQVRNEESFGNCMMASVSGICSQGSYVHSHINAIRLSLITFLLFGFIINSAYSAMLVSQLTDVMEDENCESQMCEGMPMIEANEVMATRSFRCRHRPITAHKFFSFHLGVHVTHNAPKMLTQDLRVRMIALRETGISKRIIGQWFPIRDHYPIVTINEVTLPQAQTPFLMFLISILISMCVFVVEILVKPSYPWME